MASSRIRAALLVLASLSGSVATASPNDHWQDRRQIAALPYSIVETDAQNASSDATDPAAPCRYVTQSGSGYTLWYGYTSGDATEYVTVTVGNFFFFGSAAIYTGAPGAFRIVSGGCAVTHDQPGAFRIVGMRLPPHTAISIDVSSDFSISASQVVPVSVQATPVLDVTKTDDTFDGICDADCSLREAVAQANVSPSAIRVPRGTYTLTRAGAHEDNDEVGDLDLRGDMAIYGGGIDNTVIDGGGADRVLDLDPQNECCHQYALGDLRLTNGRTVPASSSADRDGGGLRAQAGGCYVGMERLRVDHNIAYQAGGGIAMNCPDTLRQSVVANNSSGLSGGGFYYLANGLNVSAIEDSEFADNTASQGGAIHTQGNLVVDNSTVHHNQARAGGGGISQFNNTLVLANTTVMYNRGSNNSAATNTGGGVLLYAGSNDRIVNSVIARNYAADVSSSDDCAVQDATFTSAYNHVVTPNGCAFVGTGDALGGDPGLAADAAYNGGLSRTFAVLDSSAVRDAGDPAGCLSGLTGLPLTHDQRGADYARSIGGACDKGAFEYTTLAAPAAPMLDADSDTGLSQTDAITNATLLTLIGTCADGTTLVAHEGTRPLGSTVCAASVYALALTASLAEGPHDLTVDVSDGTSTSTPSLPLHVSIDLTAPSAPTITGPVSSTAPTIPVTGTATEAFGTIFLRHGMTGLGTVTVSSTAQWSFALTSPPPSFYAVSAVQTDRAGNTGPVSAVFVIRVGDVVFQDGFEG